jgi:polyisoprenoid-binding protein YceI
MKTFGKLTATLLVFVAATLSLGAADFKIDTKESQVKWTGKKISGQHFGTIGFKQGSLETSENIISEGFFEIDMQSVVCSDLENETWNSKLVGHLKSDDFFSAEKFPVSTLLLTKVEKVSGTDFSFSGSLSIKGITHPVKFNAKVEVNTGKLVAEGIIRVDRTLYDIKYSSGKFFESLGNNMIDDFFILDFKLVANESKPGIS